ncbi:hypothetical protein [Enterococcus sp. HY326]|uniref:hypothetical protein n=1 Tax=Enterococcus sp. HY326 TaxID=2971265 RepID=UPI00223F1BA8|nr:hypothetical protein [Enterococcus sp. HY326]
MMTRLKKNSFVWLIMVITFAIFMYICALVNNQVRFFTSYQDYYSKKGVSLDVLNLTIDSESFSDQVVNETAATDFFLFSLPAYNNASGVKIYFPERFPKQMEMLEGSFSSTKAAEDTVLIGKNVLATLSPSEKSSRSVEIYGKQFAIQGILADSPFDSDILLKADSALAVPWISANIVDAELLSDSSQEATTKISKLLSYAENEETYMGKILEFSLSFGNNIFNEIMQQYYGIFLQLFLVVLLSLGIHFYQRFESWQFELGIRKMVGANTLQLVGDTFKKFFLLITTAFVFASLIICVGRMAFSSYFSVSWNAIFQGLLQVFAVYALLLSLLFIFSAVYVRKVSVVDILTGVEE